MAFTLLKCLQQGPLLPVGTMCDSPATGRAGCASTKVNRKVNTTTFNGCITRMFLLTPVKIVTMTVDSHNTVK